MDEFEKKMEEMSKPEIQDLKHQNMLAERIIREKRKTALTWWWVVLPFYVTATFMMKSLYFPGTGLFKFLGEFILTNSKGSFLLFVFLPLFTIIINVQSIWKLYFYSGASINAPFILNSLFKLFLITLSAGFGILYLTLIITQ
jgi:hypothetical protein